MSDQMPDEVWTDNPLMGSGVYMLRPCGVCLYRHIRADLYERAEAGRDRLRAALEEIRDMPYSSRKPHTVFDASARAQEALDHD